MNLEDLKLLIDKDLERQFVQPYIILDKLRLVNENDRKSPPYLDASYIPFYYYLGKYLKPKNLIEIGINLGFFGCAFFKSCNTVEDYLGYQESVDEFYSKKLMIKNVKDNFRKNFDFYLGKINDQIFLNRLQSQKWDLVFVNEEKSYDKYLLFLDNVWENLSDNGYLVMEHILSHNPAKDAFNNFCKTKNRESIVFRTRYGTGIVMK